MHRIIKYFGLIIIYHLENSLMLTPYFLLHWLLLDVLTISSNNNDCYVGIYPTQQTKVESCSFTKQNIS